MNFSEGLSGYQLFLVMKNFRLRDFLEFFQLQSALDSDFFIGGVRVPTFFGHAKFEVKNFSEFFIDIVLWTLNFLLGGSRHKFCLVLPNLRSKLSQNFYLY